ncbi:MAG: hypothetical protein KDJ87_19415 [Rhizobiaceae bacterium]|nr:hypothetical protein [Rhizobiaceae bacterium]
MRLIAGLSILVSLLAAPPALAFDHAAAARAMANAVDGFIRPAYADFHAKTATLAAATHDFCADTSDAGLRDVQARFADTVESWGHIEFLRLGPVLAENRFERVLFYPDRKSTGLKQVQALLAHPDETVTDAAGLGTRSVAIQGLGAYEYLFFGAYPEGIVADKNGFRCRYAMAVARNLESIAAELQSEWDAPEGVARDWKNPSADNPVFRDDKEAISALIGIAVHGLEAVRDQRIRHFYKGKGAKVSPKLAVYWRSGLTMAALSANIDGITSFWKTTDFRLLLDKDIGSIADSVTFDLNAARKALESLDQPSADRLADPKYLAKLDFIEFNLKDAMERIDGDIGGAVGLGAGFSFADGD